jgi:signal recognition particle subunit SRP54
MFDSLSERLNGVLDRLTRRGALSEGDVDAALQEVRRALLEADVALDVARAFTDEVKKRAVGIDVIKSVTPGQMVVKIVHDQLVETLGAGAQPIDLNAPAPVAIMMVGLQGSGKTTTTAKVGKRLAETQKRKVLMASLDTRRPAAMEQLAVLGRQVGIDTLPVVAGQTPVQIAGRALQAGRLGGYDVVLLDTAGRLTLDEAMMNEAADVRRAALPHEVLLVADALTGQDAVNLARSFDQRVGLTGIVLTRVDGDGRGGAALSMRAVTGKPIKLLGTGEKLDAIEDFDPARVAGRILGMGDIVALVEKAAATIDAEKAARVAEKMRKGAFDLADLREQLAQMQNMGGMSGLMAMLPGVAKIKNQIAEKNLDEKVLKRQMAIIDSMTPKERRNPDVLKASRKRRIAAGSGTRPEDINRLLKMHRTMADVMKAMGGAKRGPMAGLANMLGMGGGMPSAEEMAKLAAKMPGGLPPGMHGGAGLPPNLPGLPPNFPGLPGTMPKLPPGFPGLGKKK